MATRRLTLNADEELLAQAQRVLGTPTATETINRSLAEVVRRHRLSRLAKRRFPDLDPETLDELRHRRLP